MCCCVECMGSDISSDFTFSIGPIFSLFIYSQGIWKWSGVCRLDVTFDAMFIWLSGPDPL